MDHKVHLLVAVAKFIVIPENELGKVVIESNARLALKVEECVSLLESQEAIWSSV